MPHDAAKPFSDQITSARAVVRTFLFLAQIYLVIGMAIHSGAGSGAIVVANMLCFTA
jgi:hypothetical protein